jgi:hypothetical protein
MARRNDWEANLASSIVGIAAIALLIAIVVVATLVWLTVTELYRIYRSRATGASQTARYLWGALVGLVGVFLVAGLSAAMTNSGTTGLIIASWGFFAYVLACEFIDYLARRNDPPLEELALADVASWQPAEIAEH